MSDRGIAQGYRARSGARYPGTVNDRLKPQRDALKYPRKACSSGAPASISSGKS